MSKWSTAVLRTIAVLDAVLSLCGFYFILMSVWGGVFSLGSSEHFRIVFAAMTAINSGLLILFLLSAFQLFRLKRSGVIMHAMTSIALIGYDLSIGIFWTSRSPVGRSVASATGVGNMGIAPFQLFTLAPYLYPILSTALLFLAVRKRRATALSAN
jgi:hypothetical protein